MRLPLILAAAALPLVATSASAQTLSCTEFRALSVERQIAVVVENDYAPDRPRDTARSTSLDNTITEARRRPDSVAQQIRDICQEQPELSAQAAAREAATNRGG